MIVSPYELLCASKPQPRPCVVMPYDLYSRIQQEPAVPVPASVSLPPDHPQPAASAVSLPVARKTHYISEIHTKHTAAGRRAAFIHEPLL